MKRFFNVHYYFPRIAEYKRIIRQDYSFNAGFRNCSILPKSFLGSKEWKYIRTYRKFQANQGTIWGVLYKKKLDAFAQKTGIDFELNTSMGPGLIIGHWGRIVVNGTAKLGSGMMITHGVTIGRDVRGKREGVPTFGDGVCIRTNSTVVGNIHIGNDVLIAPNTFVNFDVPDHSVVIGNPATIHHRDWATEGHIPNIKEIL